ANVKSKNNHRGRVKSSKPHQRWARSAGPKRNRHVKRNAEQEINGIGCLSAPIIRQAGPEEPAEHIEDANHQYESAGECWRHNVWQREPKNLSEHRFGNPKNPNASGYV